MTLRELELECWHDFGREAGIDPREVESAVIRARTADEIMDTALTEAEVDRVLARLKEVIYENIYLFSRQN